MSRGRLEAFSDGVLAIIITIMVLELGIPEGSDLSALDGLWHSLTAYLLSFVYVAIYWNNHHHLLKSAATINASIMWANMGLLFCLSLLPFSTAWVGENPRAPWPTFAYGIVLLAAAIAYFILQTVIVRHEGGKDSALGQALGADLKGRSSPVIYFVAMALAFVAPLVSEALYVVVAVMWLVPDRRLERLVAEQGADGDA